MECNILCSVATRSFHLMELEAFLTSSVTRTTAYMSNRTHCGFLCSKTELSSLFRLPVQKRGRVIGCTILFCRMPDWDVVARFQNRHPAYQTTVFSAGLLVVFNLGKWILEHRDLTSTVSNACPSFAAWAPPFRESVSLWRLGEACFMQVPSQTQIAAITDKSECHEARILFRYCSLVNTRSAFISATDCARNS